MPIRCRFLWRGGTERSFSFVFYRMQSSYNVYYASGDHFYHLGPAEWSSDRVYQRIGEVILRWNEGYKGNNGGTDREMGVNENTMSRVPTCQSTFFDQLALSNPTALLLFNNYILLSLIFLSFIFGPHNHSFSLLLC